ESDLRNWHATFPKHRYIQTPGIVSRFLELLGQCALWTRHVYPDMATGRTDRRNQVGVVGDDDRPVDFTGPSIIHEPDRQVHVRPLFLEGANNDQVIGRPSEVRWGRALHEAISLYGNMLSE